MKYICFDVETPNMKNDRMSAIGICVLEDLKITEEFYSLVDPEEPFDAFNVSLTGITPEMARRSPNFGEISKKILPIFSQGIPVAHNAQFDMSVMSKCLRAYNISFPDSAKYLCTCRLSKRVMPELPNHKLDTVCRELDISLSHHNALSDARGCALILRHCLLKGADAGEFIRSYDLRGGRTLKVGV